MSVKQEPVEPADRSDIDTAYRAVTRAGFDFEREYRENGVFMGIETYAACQENRERLVAIEHGWDLRELEATMHVLIEERLAAYLAAKK